MLFSTKVLISKILSQTGTCRLNWVLIRPIE